MIPRSPSSHSPRSARRAWASAIAACRHPARGGQSALCTRTLILWLPLPSRSRSLDEVRACVDMMSGALWVRDQLGAAGWQVQLAHARKMRDIAPLACKTDRVDARVLVSNSGSRHSMTARCASDSSGACTSSACARPR